MRSGAAWVSLRGGRAAAGAGPGSAAVAPARSARSHRRQRRQPAVPAVPRVSCAALTENGLFGGCVWVDVACLSPLVPLSEGWSVEVQTQLLWLRGALGQLLVVEERGSVPRGMAARIWGAGISAGPGGRPVPWWGTGGVLGAARGASRGAWGCPSFKVFSTASGQGDARFKVKPANYVTSQMGV